MGLQLYRNVSQDKSQREGIVPRVAHSREESKHESPVGYEGLISSLIQGIL